jgi:hypothetical protein
MILGVTPMLGFLVVQIPFEPIQFRYVPGFRVQGSGFRV